MAPIRIVLVEDNHLQRLAMENILTNEPDLMLVKSLPHGREVVPVIKQVKCDLLILDLMMATGVFDPFSTIQTLRVRYPELKILVVSAVQDELQVQNVLALGVHGYIFKSDELVLTLPKVIRDVYWGHQRVLSDEIMWQGAQTRASSLLNPDELAIITLVALGYTNEHIAEAMSLSEKTVRNHLTMIYRKLNVPLGSGSNRRVVAIRHAQELGLIP